MGNDIKTVRSTGSEYWADYVCGEKIKTDRLTTITKEPAIKTTKKHAICHITVFLRVVSVIKLRLR